jgi:peptide/nickel transport system permease protein
VGWRYALRRILQLVPALVMIVVVTFIVVHAAPGDPTGAVGNEYADEAQRQALRRSMGVDRPLWAQIFTYAGDLARGDLGDSYRFGRPVAALIGERLPATLLLTGSALLVSSTLGVLLGRAAARRPRSAADAGMTATTLVGYSIPGFWLGQVVILFFGLYLGMFPVLGMTDSHVQHRGIAHVQDVLWHLILPAGVLAVSEIALVARLTRSGLRRQLREGYARCAAAKGLSDEQVLSRHALPNAALPLLTVIGARVGFLFSGAVVVETVFSWPGIGLLLRDAVNSGDRPLTLGLVVLVAVSVLLANLVTDLLYGRMDPRVRYD